MANSFEFWVNSIELNKNQINWNIFVYMYVCVHVLCVCVCEYIDHKANRNIYS